MEIAINPSMPTYSGGLGVLAGDTLRSAADLGVPLVAFTLLHRKGYFKQHIDAAGSQTEEVQGWNPADFCTEESARATVVVEDRTVTIRAWRYDLVGRAGHIVPIYLLDTDLDGNSGTISTAATPTIACNRRLCSAWAASAWPMRWA